MNSAEYCVDSVAGCIGSDDYAASDVSSPVNADDSDASVSDAP